MSKTHDELTTLVVDVSLQRRLRQTLDEVEASTRRANLIIHHGVADVLHHAAKLIHILGTVQEPCDRASLCQRGEVLEDILQFPSKPRTSD
jgi:ABC-type glutathione transport system ATPase component